MIIWTGTFAQSYKNELLTILVENLHILAYKTVRP